MKTHLPGKILILIFVMLLPALHSCTVQKRLYRPGFYVQYHSDKLMNLRAETEKAVQPTDSNGTIKADSLPVKTPEVIATAIDAGQPTKDVAVKKAAALKRIAAAPKQLRQQPVRKQIRTHAKLTPDQRYTLGVILVIVLLIILAVLGYFNRSIFLKAIFLGLNTLQILLIVGIIAGVIYCMWLLGNCIETACGYF